MKKLLYFFIGILVPLTASAQWRNLLDKDLSQWRIYQSYTFDEASKAARDKAEAEGHPVQQIGYDVNEGNAFTVEMDGDTPILHIDGPVYGCLITKEEFGNYHLKLKVRFGEKKYEPRIDKARNTGLLYHSTGECGYDTFHTWASSHEYEILEGGTDEGSYGDYFSVPDTYMDIPSDVTNRNGLFSTKQFNPDGTLNRVGPISTLNLCSAVGEDYGSPHGQWTELELICFEDKAIHIVNGHVKMVLQNSTRRLNRTVDIPLTKGKLQLQSEAAEVYYKDVVIRPIDGIPAEYARYFEHRAKVGLQLYSVRDSLQNYMENGNPAIFGRIAEMGYDYVEPYGYWGDKIMGQTPEKFKADLDAAGLGCPSIQCALVMLPDEIKNRDMAPALARWDYAIPILMSIGVEKVILAGLLEPANEEELQLACDYMNAAGAKCREAGLSLGYHNHDAEFKEVDGHVIYDYYLQHTLSQNVFFQLDTWWAVYAHKSPVEYSRRFPGRFRSLHLKDNPVIGTSGIMGFETIFREMPEGGVEDLIVENEWYDTDQMDVAARSLNSLKKILGQTSDIEAKRKADIDKLFAYSFPDGKITSVEWFDNVQQAEPSPVGEIFIPTDGFYKVKGVVRSPSGADINFTVCLPETGHWNGKFFGSANAEDGSGVSGLKIALSKGYATMVNDMGTPKDMDENIGKPERWKDFGYRGNHLATVCAKDIVAYFYDKIPSYSYFTRGGSSAEQGLALAARYPEDYDGIFCAGPLQDRVKMQAYYLNMHQQIHRSGEFFTGEQAQAITQAALEVYGDLCGSVEGENFLAYPSRIKENPMDNPAFTSRLDGVLSDTRKQVLRSLYDGVKGTKKEGYLAYPLIPGTEASLLPSLAADGDEAFKKVFYLFRWLYGEDVDYKSVDIKKFVRDAEKKMTQYVTTVSTDLSAFSARGGKILMMGGGMDGNMPATIFMDYYKNLVAQQGLDKTLSYFRYIHMPGLGHWPFGTGVQEVGVLGLKEVPLTADYSPLVALEEWVEEGKAPERILGSSFADGNVLGKFDHGRAAYIYPYAADFVGTDPKNPDHFTGIIDPEAY